MRKEIIKILIYNFKMLYAPRATLHKIKEENFSKREIILAMLIAVFLSLILFYILIFLSYKVYPDYQELTLLLFLKALIKGKTTVPLIDSREVFLVAVIIPFFLIAFFFVYLFSKALEISPVIPLKKFMITSICLMSSWSIAANLAKISFEFGLPQIALSNSIAELISYAMLYITLYLMVWNFFYFFYFLREIFDIGIVMSLALMIIMGIPLLIFMFIQMSLIMVVYSIHLSPKNIFIY